MKKYLALLTLVLACGVTGLRAESGPDIRIIDNRVSIQAEAIPLSRLLRLLDQATGMTSKVPPELANRNVSVRFSNLSFDDAVDKIFEGQPLDYVLVAGKGIIVTGTSQTLNARNNPGPSTAPPAPQDVFNDENQAFINNQQQQIQQQPPMPGMAVGVPNQNQPAMIQTPFGAIPNPRANQPNTFPQNAAPMVTPGQMTPQNPFNSTLPGFNSSNQLPTLQSNPSLGGTPPSQPAQPNYSPFSSPSAYPGMSPSNGFPGITPTQPRPNP